jgi:phosphoribosylaminoimidazole-succinocarboxamide synthase
MFDDQTRATFLKQLPHTLAETPNRTGIEKYRGKVRDSFLFGDKRLLVTTDRLSAFDRVLTTLPFKGHILNQMASFWFNQTKDIVPNHIISEPHPMVLLAKEVKILPVEVVVRGYLAGSGWRDYEAGRDVSGIKLPKGLRKSHRFDQPMITPSTKAEIGTHDMPISSAEVISSGIVDRKVWEKVCEYALALFEFGTKLAAKQGLILVDTKYEFGIVGSTNEVVLADEIHTSDSSRFWFASTYEEAYQSGENPNSLDKEFLRKWLIDRGYMGEGEPPQIPDEMRVELALRYYEAFRLITGTDSELEVGSEADKIAEVVNALK